MPVFAWVMGKLVLIGGYAVVYVPVVLGVALTGYAAVKLGQAVGDAVIGGSDVAHGTRIDLASPKEMDELQRKSTEGQVKQHVALAEAAKQVPQIVGGTTELAARGAGGSGVNRPDRDILEIEPIDTLTEPWSLPRPGPGPNARVIVAFQPAEGPVTVGKPTAVTLIVRGLTNDLDLEFQITAGSASVQRSGFRVSHGGSTPDCDKVGGEWVCGNSVTAEQPGPVTLEALYDGGGAVLKLEAKKPPQVYQNLVVDGGFESGGIGAPWGSGIYEPNPAGPFWGRADATASVTSTGAHSGQFALRVDNRSKVAGNVYRTLSQKVNVAGGAQHCLSFWTRTANPGTGGSLLTFRLNDSWGSVIGVGAGPPDYRQYAFSFVAEDDNIDVRMVFENEGTVWVDDIFLSSGACAVANGVLAPGAEPRQ